VRILFKALLFLIVFNDVDVVAHAITFFLDGFETSSAALSFSLYALATNPDVQDRVREEVESVLRRHGGELTFDDIQEMTYLDMFLAGILHAFVENFIYRKLFGHLSVLKLKQLP
jgi:cytochrome P450